MKSRFWNFLPHLIHLCMGNNQCFIPRCFWLFTPSLVIFKKVMLRRAFILFENLKNMLILLPLKTNKKAVKSFMGKRNTWNVLYFQNITGKNIVLYLKLMWPKSCQKSQGIEYNTKNIYQHKDTKKFGGRWYFKRANKYFRHNKPRPSHVL